MDYSEVAKHNTADDCWVIIHGKVYDLSSFHKSHPGGSAIIVKYAGKDATEAFEPFHNPDIVRTLPPACRLGEVNMGTVPAPPATAHSPAAAASAPASPPGSTSNAGHRRIAASADREIPSEPIGLEDALNVFDLIPAAFAKMTEGGWAYYDSGAEDELTLADNTRAFSRLLLCPKILVDVSRVDTTASMLGSRAVMPAYATSTALAKLAHPSAEIGIIKGAAAAGVPYMIPTLSSASLSSMLAAVKEVVTAADQASAVRPTFWFQLYVNANRSLTAEILREVVAAGISAIFITVDAPMFGRRERDMRFKLAAGKSHVQSDAAGRAKDAGGVKIKGGTAGALTRWLDSGLDWSIVRWVRTVIADAVPVLVKGVQRGEDAVLAAHAGAAGVVLSNHGARQLDTSRAPIDVLPETVAALKAAGVPRISFSVFVDCGVRRGTDVLKAIALGADGVGVGRPVLWGLAGYGESGVTRCFEMLQDELAIAMANVGASKVSDVEDSMVAHRPGDRIVRFGAPTCRCESRL